MLRIFKFHALDLREAASNLVARNPHFAHVGMRLLNMPGQFFHSVVKARKVLRQFAQLILDHMRHAPCFGVAQYCTHGVQNRHQRSRRRNPHALALRVLH